MLLFGFSLTRKQREKENKKSLYIEYLSLYLKTGSSDGQRERDSRVNKRLHQNRYLRQKAVQKWKNQHQHHHQHQQQQPQGTYQTRPCLHQTCLHLRPSSFSLSPVKISPFFFFFKLFKILQKWVHGN